MAQRHSLFRCARPPLRTGTAFVFPMLAALLLVLAIAGCAGQDQNPVRIPDDRFGQYIPLTLPIILVGDTQEHEATGFPLLQSDGAVDSYVEVAQRPPEQPLFGRRLLEWAIEHHPDKPMIHLGDVIDMSCLSEHRRMQKIFEKARQPVALTTGNHDGLLFGIFNYDIVATYMQGEALEWQRGCRPGTGLEGEKSGNGRGLGLSKRNFIAGYLRRLSTGHLPQEGLPVPADSGHVTVSWVNPDPQGFIERIEADLVDGRDYAQSFILHKLRLPPAPGAPLRTTIVAMDTSQLNVAIGFFSTAMGESPGDVGLVMEGQAKVVSQWVSEARKAGEIVIFAGHHPWAMLSPGTRLRLEPILESVDHPLVYISAHTHSGFWALHRVGGRDLLELNVSSLSDWPLAYRRVSFAYDPQARRIRVTGELLPSAATPVENDQELLDAWTRPSCGQAGIPVAQLTQKDIAEIETQKQARGSLVEWLLRGMADLAIVDPEQIDESTDPAEIHDRARQKHLGGVHPHEHFGKALKQEGDEAEQFEANYNAMMKHYEAAHPYKDALLGVIIELYDDMGATVEELSEIRAPAFCGDETVRDCAVSLREAKWDYLAASIALYRKKAAFVDDVERQLDEIEDPKAKGYMTCRAAIAAKLDHEMTPEETQPGTPEGERRRLGFFRSAATVGMD
jgi:hypothetical protein